jgi:bifunctional DNA-binding transcriptional regulator/antitoxin component of YhaV-PrlF toxin-antitoxin module
MVNDEIVLGKSKLSSQWQVHLPSTILPFLKMKPKDDLEFILGPNKEIIIRKSKQ